nr:uncharacterized protein LOC113813146 [Penaeus vannamei]
MAAETEMSVDSLDTSLVDLTIGEATMERLTRSVLKADPKSPTRPDTSGLPEDDISDDGGRGDDLGVGVGVGGTPLDLSMKVATSMGVMSSPSSTSHARKLAAREGGEREKEAWASSMRDLATPSRRSCRPEGLAKGAPPVRPLVHGRLLRPRGDAAAARGVPCHAPLTPTPRYRATAPGQQEHAPSLQGHRTPRRGHNVAFAAPPCGPRSLGRVR